MGFVSITFLSFDLTHGPFAYVTNHSMPPGHPWIQGQTPTERATLAEVQEQRAELAMAHADVAAMVACASEHKPDLGPKLRSSYTLLSASSTVKMWHVLRSSTL